jgi:hypothetical protein
MAVHLWIGRVFSVLAIVLFGLASTAQAEHFLTHPAASDAQTPVAPQAPVGTQAAVAAPRGVRKLFEEGTEIKIERDANIYITRQNIPKNDRFLKAYAVDKATGSQGTAVPGLLGIAAQAYRTQRGSGKTNKAYSLADAMRDAVWRKQTAAMLKTLTSSRRPSCAEGAESLAGASLSIGLGTTC